MADHAHCLTNGIRTRSTCRHGRKCRPFALITHSNHTGSHVRDHHRNKERRYLARSFFHQLFMFIHESLNSADTCADIDTDPLVSYRPNDPALFNCLRCCSNCKLCIDIAVQNIHFFHVCTRIKVLYFCSDFHFIISRVKLCDRRDPAAAVFYIFPKSWYIISKRTDNTHTSNYNSIHWSLLISIVLSTDFY